MVIIVMKRGSLLRPVLAQRREKNPHPDPVPRPANAGRSINVGPDKVGHVK